jgi:peptidoglycan L-alanyl-D-glutamate endopeptidase CwlK
MPSRKTEDLHPILADIYKRVNEKFRARYPNLPQPFTTCTYRNDEEQTKLYAIGRTEVGKIVTNAKAGESAHNRLPSMAFDIAFITLDNRLDWSAHLFAKYAEIAKEISSEVEWGGDWRFKDFPHFELKNWKNK